MKSPLEGPRVSLSVSGQTRTRLDAIRAALGADRAVLARRLPAGSAREMPFEIVGVVPGGLHPHAAVPLEAFRTLFTRSADLQWEVASASPRWSRRLRRMGLVRLQGFVQPGDRLAAVAFVLAWESDRRPTATHEEVARAGMEALARLYVPPTWLPLAAPRRGRGMPGSTVALEETLRRVEHALLLRALRVADGNKSLAARHLQLSRQGLYRRLHRHGLMDGCGGLDSPRASP